MAATRARQSKYQFTNAQRRRGTPPSYWRIDWLLQPQNYQVRAGIAPADAR
jgi:hypothetical protein